MLDATPTRSSYLSSHSSGSNSPHHQHALSTIRNAIASESQRIRVQDESTGKSYELQLGKEVPYPQHFGDDSEELSIDGSEGQADVSRQSNGTPSRILSRSGPSTPNNGSHTPRGSPSTPSNGHSTAHRVLRLPLIVKGRSSANASASTPNGHTSNSSQSTTHSDDAANGNGSSNGHSSGSSNPDQAVRLNEVEEKPPKAILAQKRRLQTPPAVPGGPTSANGNADGRPSSELVTDNDRQGDNNAKVAESDKAAAAKQAQEAKGPLQGDAKKLDGSSEPTEASAIRPNVDGLPPQSDENRFATTTRGLPATGVLDSDSWQAKARMSPTSIRTNIPRRANRRQSSYASTSTAYVSADESLLDSGAQTAAEDFDSADEETPTTPIARQPEPMLLRSSPEPSPALLDDQQRTTDGVDTLIGARSSSPRQRRASNSSVETSKASRTLPIPAPPLNTSNSTTASYLHPSSAKPGQPPSPSRRNRSVPPRAQPPRRNTTGSSAGSMDSARQRPVSAGGLVNRAASVRRGSRDRWMPGMAPSDQSHDDVSPTSPIPPFAAQASASGTLRTGDAGFDEELAKAEANVRKRKERAKREEEEKALVAKEAEKNEALERGEKRSGMPGLIRAKSGMGKGGPIAAAAQGPQTATPATREFEEKALVGNIINEGHVNYVLMYNMLTGIRIGVSRCQAKNKRPLADEDYKAKHKFTFDIIGNELTPSAKYDFKFKDYAPWVFRELREHFHLDPADYLLSLTAKYILSELGSPGKSGSFFYFSRDYRFIIKTIRHSEHKFLRRILKDYHEHVKANPHTLLSRFYGLHRVKLPHGRKIHFVIMNNIFPPHRDIHETYDLKGSSYGREYPEEKAKTKKGATLKDINWIRRRRELELGPEKRALFEAQLASDVALLKRLNIMDYSLLIGLHDMKRGNSENLRQEKLQVVQPETAGNMTSDAEKQAGPPNAGHSHHRPHVHHSHPPARPSSATRRGSATTTWSEDDLVDAEASVGSPIPGSSNSNHSIANQAVSTPGVTPSSLAHATSKRVSEKDAYALRAAVRRSDAKALGSSSAAQLPARETSERRHFLFEQDEGGFRSTDEENRPGDWIYYLGIIDLFTPYSGVKRGENFWKSLSQDSRMISAVPPKQYGNRFVKFLTAVVRPMKWKDLPPGFEKVEEMKEQ